MKQTGKLLLLTLVIPIFATPTIGAPDHIIHDGECYFIEQQHKEAWDAED